MVKSFNILFLYNGVIDPKKGGVERVTSFLGDYFKINGCNVFFLSSDGIIPKGIDRHYTLPDSPNILTKRNIIFFQSLIVENEISIVINQGATNPQISKLAIYSLPQGVRLISVIHNSILSSINNFSAVNKIKYTRLGIGFILKITDFKIVKTLLLWLFKFKYRKHYRLICKKSNRVVILSEKYRPELRFLTGGLLHNNIVSIYNPVPFLEIPSGNKLKEVLYVGRVNFSQKRVDFLLQIWRLVHDQFPEWSLKIVGNGEDFNQSKSLAKQLNLKNVLFFGFSDPIPFYQTASVFCMTSSFEGFPLTLIESMSCGSVPIVFNSFLSASEIIDDGINGFLIPTFDLKEYSRVLSELMLKYNSLEEYGLLAKEKVKKFNISNIGDRWFKLFDEVNSVS